MDTLLSLEPRIAGENPLEPHAEFPEIHDGGEPPCFATTTPTCFPWTSVCIESTTVC